MSTFINKDLSSANVSRLTPDERQRINEQSREHRVSARRARARARANQGYLVPSTTIGLTQQHSSSITASSTISTSGSQEGRLIPSFPSTSQTRTPRPGPGSSFDPFQTSSVSFNAYILQILRYFRDVYYASLWLDISTALEDHIDAKYLLRCTPERIIRECMANRTRMYCLLADVACHMPGMATTDTGTTTTTSDSSCSSQQLQLVSRGTEALRQEMARRGPNIDGEVLVSAFHLYLAATTISLEEAARAHMAGVKAIIRDIVRRGIPINVVYAAMLALVDMEMALQLLEQMNLRSLTHPKVPIYVPVTSFERPRVRSFRLS